MVILNDHIASLLVDVLQFANIVLSLDTYILFYFHSFIENSTAHSFFEKNV